MGKKQYFDFPEVIDGFEIFKDQFSVLVPEEGVNLITNPSFENNSNEITVYYALTNRTTVESRRGVYGLQVMFDTLYTSSTYGVYYSITAVAPFESYTFSLYVKQRGNYKLYVTDDSNVLISQSKSYRFKDDNWHRINVSYYDETGGLRRLYIVKDYLDNNMGNIFYIDGLQLENKSYMTTYIDGDINPNIPNGYGWAGNAHASTSFRHKYERTGGKEYKFTDLGFMIAGVQGLGDIPINHITTESVLGGEYYHDTIGLAREFTIVGSLEGKDQNELMSLRSGLLNKLKFNAFPYKQPLTLRYRPLINDILGEPYDIQCLFMDGMKMNLSNPFQERIALVFKELQPGLIEDGDEGVSLGYQIELADVNYITMFDSTGNIVNMGNGLNGKALCSASAVDGIVYIGGEFTLAGELEANHVVKYSNGQFTALGDGLDGDVLCIAIDKDGIVWFGGEFTGKVATWNGVSLSIYAFTPNSNYYTNDSINTVIDYIMRKNEIQESENAISGGDTNGYPKGNAFDGTNSTIWYSLQTGEDITETAYIGQEFSEEVDIVSMDVTQTVELLYKVQYSDDGDEWTTLTTNSALESTITLPYSGFHYFWRLLASASNLGGANKVSAVDLSISGGDTNGYPKGNAFDSSDIVSWQSSQSGSSVIGNAYIGQDFGYDVAITSFRILQSVGVFTSLKLQYSDGGSTWSDQETFLDLETTDETLIVSDSDAHSHWRVLANGAPVSTKYIDLYTGGISASLDGSTISTIASNKNCMFQSYLKATDYLSNSTLWNTSVFWKSIQKGSDVHGASYIGVAFNSPTSLYSITLMQKNRVGSVKLQYSDDGIAWVNYGTYDITYTLDDTKYIDDTYYRTNPITKEITLYGTLPHRYWRLLANSAVVNKQQFIDSNSFTISSTPLSGNELFSSDDRVTDITKNPYSLSNVNAHFMSEGKEIFGSSLIGQWVGQDFGCVVTIKRIYIIFYNRFGSFRIDTWSENLNDWIAGSIYTVNFNKIHDITVDITSRKLRVVVSDLSIIGDSYELIQGCVNANLGHPDVTRYRVVYAPLEWWSRDQFNQDDGVKHTFILGKVVQDMTAYKIYDFIIPVRLTEFRYRPDPNIIGVVWNAAGYIRLYGSNDKTNWVLFGNATYGVNVSDKKPHKYLNPFGATAYRYYKVAPYWTSTSLKPIDCYGKPDYWMANVAFVGNGYERIGISKIVLEGYGLESWEVRSFNIKGSTESKWKVENLEMYGVIDNWGVKELTMTPRDTTRFSQPININPNNVLIDFPFTVSNISIYLMRKAGVTGDVTAKIYSGATTPTTLLFTSSIVDVTSVPTDYGWVDFAFDDVSLNYHTKYWVVFDASGLSGFADDQYISCGTNEVASTTFGGSGYQSINGTWTSVSECMLFIITATFPIISQDVSKLYYTQYLYGTYDSGKKLLQFDPSVAWYSLGQTDTAILDIAYHGGAVYICGDFTTVNSVSKSKIAKYQSGTWYAINNASNDIINSLVSYKGYLLAGGEFTSIGGINASKLAKWTGTSWVKYGQELFGIIKVLRTDGNTLYAIGGNVEAPNIDILYTYDGNSWRSANYSYPSNFSMFSVDAVNKRLITGFDEIGNVLSEKLNRFEVGGNVVTYPIFDITGPGSLKKIGNYENNKFIYANIPLILGEHVRIVLHPNKITATSNLTGNALSGIYTNSDFRFELVPGTTNISVLLKDGTTDTKVTMNWKKRFSGIDL